MIFLPPKQIRGCVEEEPGAKLGIQAKNHLIWSGFLIFLTPSWHNESPNSPEKQETSDVEQRSDYRS
jgi:hypothetical protein